MKKFAAGAASFLVCVVALSGTARAVDDGGLEIIAADSAGYPTVSAMVATPPGAAIAAETFDVLEAGLPVEATVERLPTEDLEVILLLDMSGSMTGAPLESEKAAANEFLSLLPPDVRAGVVAYGTTPTLLAAPSTDRQAVSAAIAPLLADTDTALYDAVIFAGTQFTPDADRRALVLLTDGEDNASSATIDAAAAVATGLPIHVIELLTDRSDRPALDRLAGAGGGTVTTATDPAALSDLYRQAAGTIANQYRLTYTSTASGPVELTVRAPSAGGDLFASTTIELPVAAPAPTTAPATTSPPPTTVVPTTTPLTTPVPTAPPVRALSTIEPDAGGGSNVGLLVGAAAVFATIMLIAALVLAGDGGRERIRSGLGLARGV